MNNNVTHTSTTINPPIVGVCPSWCVEHEKYDVGHRDEGVIHVGRCRTYRGHTMELRRDQLLRERRGTTVMWVDGEEMTPTQAKRLGQLLIDTADGLA